MSYTDYTLTDAIDGIRRKMNQEHEALQDADVVRAIRVRCRLRALREELYETEVERLSCYQALVPFLPETAESQPVALQSDPTPQYNGQHGFDREGEFFGHEPESEWAGILRRAG